MALTYNSGGFKLTDINNFKQGVKEILTYKNMKIGVEYYPYDIRHGNVLKSGYGHIRGYIGNDNMSLDCYIHPRLWDKDRSYEHLPLIVISQVHPWTGLFDEDKVMLGFTDVDEATKHYLNCMPKQMLGSIRYIKDEDISYL